tara:strand:+ start:332 stop:781 length:450 start_codon:yes stop_codon:yes gene_type:complete
MTTTKYRKKTNKRNTLKRDLIKTNFVVRKLMEALHNIQIIYSTNSSILPDFVFEEIFNKIKSYIKIFTKGYMELPKRQLLNIESTLKSIKYNNERTFNSKLFEYIQILDELNLFLDHKKNKVIIEIKDELIDEIQRFISFLNDSTYHKD